MNAARDRPRRSPPCCSSASTTPAAPRWRWVTSTTWPVTERVAWSGGSEPADEINPAAVAAMAEVGIDITGEFPKPWTDEVVQAADVVVTMGCGDACPFFPGKRYENWELPDPAGQGIDAVRPIRDDVEDRVRQLLGELGIQPVA